MVKNTIHKYYYKYIIFIIVFIVVTVLLFKNRLFDASTSVEGCTYVSSRGIMNMCNVHSLNPVSSTRSIDDIDFTKVTDGCTVYVAGSAIPAFVNKLPSLPCRIILVSGDCDESIPEAIFPTDKAFKEFIKSDKIIHWYSQNYIGNHPKVTGIPIGLDYHTQMKRWNKLGPSMSAIDQEAQLNKVKNEAKHFYERRLQCYSNFHFNKPNINQYNSLYVDDRTDAIGKIPKDIMFYEPTQISRLETFKNQCKYAFVVSPHGNGLDCHRTWEALCLGCIPIVKTSPIDSLFDDLPVLIVKDWSDVTKTHLESTITTFKDKVFNYDKLTLTYWMKIINTRY